MKRPIATSMLYTGIFLFGIVSYGSLIWDLAPEPVFPVINVETIWSGANVYKLEKYITIPLEDSLSGLPGLENMSSQSEDGKSTVQLDFKNGTNIDTIAMEVRERTETASLQFPKESHKSLLKRYSRDNKPVLVYTLEGKNGDLTALREYAERNIKPYFEKINGVASVMVSGGRVREIQVLCDAEKLAEYGIDFKNVTQAIRSHHTALNFGKISLAGGAYPVNFFGKLNTPEEINRIPIVSSHFGIIQIQDVAKVILGLREEDTASRYQGKETVGLYLYTVTGANLLDISDEANSLISNNSDWHSISIQKRYDRSEPIRSLRNFFLLYITLSILVPGFYLFFHPMQRQITSVILIINILTPAFWILLHKVFSLHANPITITSLITAELIYLLSLINKNSLSLSIKSILFTILVPLSLSFPAVLFEPDAGKIIFQYSCLFISSVIFQEITGLVMQKIIPQTRSKKGYLEYYLEQIKCMLQLKQKTIFYKANSIFEEGRFLFTSSQDWLKNKWEFLIGILNKKIAKYLFNGHLLNEEYLSKLILIITGILVSGFIFISSSKEWYFFSNSNMIIAYVEYPSGTSFKATDDGTKKIEGALLKSKYVSEVTSRTEAGRGILMITLQNVSNQGADILRKDIGPVEPAYLHFSGESNDPFSHDITYDVLGEEVDEIHKIVLEASETVKKLPQVEEVVLRYKIPREEKSLIPLEGKYESEITPLEIGDWLKMALQGGVAAKMIQNYREMDIRVRPDEKYRKTMESVQRLKISGKKNTGLPVVEVLRMMDIKSPVKIYRKLKKRMLSFSVRAPESIRNMILRTLADFKKKLPDYYTIEEGKNTERRIKMQLTALFSAITSIILLFFLNNSLENSLKKGFLRQLQLAIPFTILIVFSRISTGSIGLPTYFALILLVWIIQNPSRQAGAQDTKLNQCMQIQLPYPFIVLPLIFTLAMRSTEVDLLKQTILHFIVVYAFLNFNKKDV